MPAKNYNDYTKSYRLDTDLRKVDIPMSFEFWKYHGLGNDFVIVDARHIDPTDRTPALAIQICDRHRGIGADGILWVESSDVAEFRMVITNSDGSRPEMCGNGLRCFAWYLYEQKYTQQRAFSVETDRGVLRCELLKTDAGAPGWIKIEMGAPILERSNIPMVGPQGHCVDESLQVADESLRVTGVSMGNPHAVFFDVPRDKQETLGPLLEKHPVFPQRTNVEFVQVRATNELDVRVYERGCGWTQACGTGACASVVAAILTKRIPHRDNVVVQLPGGILDISVLPDFSNVWMSGPAASVFCGTWLIR